MILILIPASTTASTVELQRRGLDEYIKFCDVKGGYELFIDITNTDDQQMISYFVGSYSGSRAGQGMVSVFDDGMGYVGPGESVHLEFTWPEGSSRTAAMNLEAENYTGEEGFDVFVVEYYVKIYNAAAELVYDSEEKRNSDDAPGFEAIITIVAVLSIAVFLPDWRGFKKKPGSISK